MARDPGGDGPPEPGEAPPYPAALSDPDAQIAPFEWYREMQRESPVRYDERRGAWDVFRHETVDSILRDHERFSSARETATDGPPSMLSSDPPRHTRLRSPVEGRFAPDTVGDLEPEIRRMTDDLLDDALAGEARMDVVDDLARWLPMVTIAALLGVPPEERATFKEWSDTIVAGPQLTGGDRDQLRSRQQAAIDAMQEYLADVMARRAEEPRDDLISDVLAAAGEDLSTAEIRGILQLLLIAGNVTTTNLIANAVWCFATEDVDAGIRRDGAALETAVEEVLRYRSPVQWTTRIATESLEVEGHEIAEGARIRTWIGAANRDPAVFDEPATFRPDRSPNDHLAFGRGIHFCLGAALARLEARVALAALFERVENPRLLDAPAAPVASPFLYGVQELPIGFDRRQGGQA